MTIVVGIPGPQGIPGEAGAAGTNGTNGNTMLTTSGAPSNSIGNNGDFANDPVAQVMYGPKAGGVWPSPGMSYKGTNGTNGANGATWRTGSGAPSNSLGVDGDLYLDVAADNVYQRASGTYSIIANIKGADGAQGAPGASAKYVTGTPYTGLVATRGKAMTNGNVSVLQHNSRSIHTARVNITQLGVAVANWYVGAGEVNGGADATVQIGIEYPLGSTVTPLTFSGSTTGTVYDFGTLFSDLLTISIPSGAQFAVREYRVCQSGGSVIYSGASFNMGPDTNDGDCYEYGASLTNRSGTPGTFASTSTTFYRPLAIFGPTNQPSYALIGDSRVEGYQDNPLGNLYVGMFERSVGPMRAFMNLAKGGEQLATVVGSNMFSQRLALIKRFATHVISNYGINDISSGAAATLVTSQICALRNSLQGKYFYQTTLDTETTSTDVWTTTVNQTPSAGMTTLRKYCNSWFRSNAANTNLFDGVFDTTTVTESSFNSALWKPGIVADGIHPNPTGYANIASSGVIVVA